MHGSTAAVLCAGLALVACSSSRGDEDEDDAGSPPTPSCASPGDSCTDRSDCCGEAYGCVSGKCTQLKAVGDACGHGDECLSSVCDVDSTCCNDAFLTAKSDCTADADCCFGGSCRSGACCYAAGKPATTCFNGFDPSCCSESCNDSTGNCL